MRLPNADRAMIAPEKIRDYLFVLEHPQNQGKARLFAALGYTRENWLAFESDLRTQHLPLDAQLSKQTDFGDSYEIVGELLGPQGSAIIMSVWIIDRGSDVPRFVTARRP
jgi:hypothetical protein